MRFCRSLTVKISVTTAICLLLAASTGGGVIPGGAGGAVAPPSFGQQHFFSVFGFSHNTDRKVLSEVVLMGSFMSVILW